MGTFANTRSRSPATFRSLAVGYQLRREIAAHPAHARTMPTAAEPRSRLIRLHLHCALRPARPGTPRYRAGQADVSVTPPASGATSCARTGLAPTRPRTRSFGGDWTVRHRRGNGAAPPQDYDRARPTAHHSGDAATFPARRRPPQPGPEKTRRVCGFCWFAIGCGTGHRPGEVEPPARCVAGSQQRCRATPGNVRYTSLLTSKYIQRTEWRDVAAERCSALFSRSRAATP
jgi:hypothetical protein